MLSKTIKVNLISLKKQDIIKQWDCALYLKDKHLEYFINAKVQDKTEDGINDGKPRNIELKRIFFRENISEISSAYLDDSSYYKVSIESNGAYNAMDIYVKTVEEANSLVNDLLNYRLGTQ